MSMTRSAWPSSWPYTSQRFVWMSYAAISLPKNLQGQVSRGKFSLMVYLTLEQPFLLPNPVASPGHACPQEKCVMKATMTSWLTLHLERMVSYIAPLHSWLSCMQLRLAVIEKFKSV